MNKLREYAFIYLFGATLYSLIEVLFRGYTHWTMMLTGGAAYLVLYIANLKMKTKNFFLRCAVGCLIITAIEFAAGCIVNRVLHLGVWDYSARPMHLLGQICPLFSFFWFLLSFPAALLCFFMKLRLFTPGSKKIKLRQLFLK